MKSEKWTGVRAASVAGVWVAILFIICGARAQESKEKVTINDVDRAYVVRLPRGYDQERKYPVVILLHGMNQDGDDMARLTRFNELADKDSIIAVYPSALHGRWNVGVRPPLRRVMGPGPRRYPGGGYPRRYPRRGPPGGLVAVNCGGDTVLGNMVPACSRCDDSKRDVPFEEWMRSDAQHSPKSRRIPDLDQRIIRLHEYTARYAYSPRDAEERLGVAEREELTRLRQSLLALRKEIEQFLARCREHSQTS